MATSSGHNLHFNLDPIYSYPTLNDRGFNLLHQIAGLYEAGNRREQSEILMDGTFAMMARSHQMDCATDLGAPLPVPVPLARANVADSETVPPPAQTDQIQREESPPASALPAPTFKKCRKCSGDYLFSLPSGDGDVTVIGGAPNFSAPPSGRRPYKTMSYVWGSLPPSSPISVPCLACGHTNRIPMLSVQRFHNLMSLGGGGNAIWLDALSIDQEDAEDVKANLAIMGEIYKNAVCVSVLLPSSDRAAYECLEAIERDAKVILMHRGNFVHNTEIKMEDPESGENVNILSMVCQMFLENIQSLAGHLHRFAYWSRAWTFQEWALAPDLEVAVEGWNEPSTCFNLKSLILGAAMLISRYKILQHQYAEIKLGRDMSRGMVPPLFSVVKALFPDEDLFLSYEETDPKSVSFQTNFPHNGITDLLGIRSVPLPSTPPSASSNTAATDSTSPLPTPRSVALASRPTPLSQLRARLILLLSAFASSKRFAKYEADLVACWASMCNVPYAYDRDDDFTTAKRKVIDALRRQGMVVYDFFPDPVCSDHMTSSSNNPSDNSEGEEGRRRKSPVDMFRMYAKEQPQMNATNNAEFPGAPMFTGRADTVSHLIFSLENISFPSVWESESNSGVESSSLTSLDTSTFVRVQDASITNILCLSGGPEDLSKTLETWDTTAIYGHLPGLAGFQFWDTHEVAKVYLEKIPSSRREMGKLIVVKVKFYKRKLVGADDGSTMLESQIRAQHRAHTMVASGDTAEKEEEAGPSTNAEPEIDACDLHLWAIVPSDIPTANLEVCREPINGALVLVLNANVNDRKPRKHSGQHLIAYLVLSDHLSGSFLVCPSQEGRIDLEVRVPERGDMSNSVYRQFSVRRIFGDVQLGPEIIV